jgi:hypothetical protein
VVSVLPTAGIATPEGTLSSGKFARGSKSGAHCMVGKSSRAGAGGASLLRHLVPMLLPVGRLRWEVPRHMGLLLRACVARGVLTVRSTVAYVAGGRVSVHSLALVSCVGFVNGATMGSGASGGAVADCACSIRVGSVASHRPLVEGSRVACRMGCCL